MAPARGGGFNWFVCAGRCNMKEFIIGALVIVGWAAALHLAGVLG